MAEFKRGDGFCMSKHWPEAQNILIYNATQGADTCKRTLGIRTPAQGLWSPMNMRGQKFFEKFYLFAASEMTFIFPGTFCWPTRVQQWQECVGQSTICSFWYQFGGIFATIGRIFPSLEVHFGACPSMEMLTFFVWTLQLALLWIDNSRANQQSYNNMMSITY